MNELAASQQIVDLRGINAFCYSTAVNISKVGGVPQRMSLTGVESYVVWMSFAPVFLCGSGRESFDLRLL